MKLILESWRSYLKEDCWDGYKKVGMKKKGDKMVPNCVPLEEEVIEEKDDRCTRIAKRKYDVWPSAYASGAVVRCRAGKIWKDVKEEMDIESLLENTEYEDLLETLQEMELSDEEAEELRTIEKELNKASKMHKGQADRIGDVVKEEKMNCGCGQDPCVTYGIQEAKKEGIMMRSDELYGLIAEEVNRVLLERDVFPYLTEAFLDDGTPVCAACLMEQLDTAACGCPDLVYEAEYQGRKVTLNKPTRGDVKKFKVYVKDPKTGNVKKVNFGHGGSSAKAKGEKTMKIRKSNPKARKNFRARHNCDNPGPKTKARYWSCKKW